MIIITADDYGKDFRTTDNILECADAQRITAASAMVFMEDAGRAASLVTDRRIEVGLHLNFTLPFTGANLLPRLALHQARIASYLTRRRSAQALYNSILVDSFKYVYRAQEDEFLRLYGRRPDFINGHHHMHLCANMLCSRMLRPGQRIRRPFSLESTHKGLVYCIYQTALGWLISRRFASTDAFFSIVPLQDVLRLERIASRGNSESIEIEVHPEISEEALFLKSDLFLRIFGKTALGGFRSLPTVPPKRRGGLRYES